MPAVQDANRPDADLIRQLLKHAPIGIAATLLNSSILVFIQWRVISHSVLLIWLGAITFVTCVRYGLIYRVHRLLPHQYEPSRFYTQLLVGIGLSGTLWGSAGIFLFATQSITHQAFLAFVLGGMVAGAAGTFSAVMRAFFAFSVPTLTPLIMRFFLLGDEFHLAMGGMTLLFWIMMFFTAKRLNATTLAIFRLNASLAEAMEHAEAINEELKLEIQERIKVEEELRRHREHLSEMVAERTAELTAANAQLINEVEERKRAQEAQRKSEEKYRHLVENVSDVIYATDKDGIITYVSPTVESLSNYQPAQILGRHFTEFIHPADLAMVTSSYERVASGQNSPTEYRVMTASGESRWVRGLSNRLMEGDRLVGLQGVLTDITYRKEAEQERDRLEVQLRQAQKLEALGTLAGGIAHDFNNILAAIIGYTEMMLLDTPETHSMHGELKQVLQAAGRARDLVKQILVFSRMKDLHEKVPTDIVDIVREAVRFVQTTLPTSIDLREDISCDRGMILADASQIHQSLINLCENAAHAMEEDGGLLTVALQEVSFDQEIAALHPELQAGSYFRLTIRDTGHGMDSATIERIFDPYFTTKQVGKGSGLGLAVVHGIVRRHLGTVTVYSEVGKGTTFHVYLPRLETRADAEDSCSSAIGIDKRTKTVLFVDDEADLAAIGKRMLSQLGYEVVAKTSSVEALEVFRAHPDQFDLVMTDFSMPAMTGADLATEILRVRPGLPVVLCSGYHNEIDEEKAKRLGIAEFVLKPFNMHVLEESARRALEKERV